MIHVERVPEPASFDEEVRKPGARWLNEHPSPSALRPLWRRCLPELSEGFRGLCGYLAMHVESGTVDHYLSTSAHRALAYEWDNYRFASERMNSIKGDADDRVLDPFVVCDGWFELLLPSLELIATPNVPEELRDRAAYDQFLQDELTLPGLRRAAPRVAEAVERELLRSDIPRR